MSYPTLQNILDEMRSNLGDDQVAGGEICTNTLAIPQAQAAVREMASAMKNVCDIRILKTAYWILPANTSVLIPSTAGIADLAQPLSLEERGNVQSAAIAGAVFATPTLTMNVPAHGFQNYWQVTQSKIVGMPSANGQFAITVVDSDHYIINGAVDSGTYASGGIAAYSPDNFQWMDYTENPGSQQNNSGYLRYWTWDASANGFRFVPTGAARQLRIRYESSATVPVATSDVVYVDDSLSFLGLWGAARFARSRQASDHFASLSYLACGEARIPDGSRPGGALWGLLQSSVRQMQRMPSSERTRPFFKEPRALIDAVFIG